MLAGDRPPPRRAKVTVNDEPERECPTTSCGLRADLLVSVNPQPSELNPPGYRVGHWVQISSLLLDHK